MPARITPAVTLLDGAAVTYTLHPYEAHSSEHGDGGYGDRAASALGLDRARIFKTLVAMADRPTVAVVPVSGSLDLKALAAAVGQKRARMAAPADAERLTGYVRGGISPLGGRTALPTVVDVSATAFPTVFVSAGRRGLQVELDPQDLIRLTHAVVAQVSTAA